MMLLPLIMALSLASADPPTDTGAAPTASVPPRLLQITFTRIPSVSEFLYPHEAYIRHRSGTAVIECGVLTTGELTNCTLVSETPTGFRFGEKALQMKRFFRVRKPEGPCPDNLCGIAHIPIVFAFQD